MTGLGRYLGIACIACVAFFTGRNFPSKIEICRLSDNDRAFSQLQKNPDTDDGDAVAEAPPVPGDTQTKRRLEFVHIPKTGGTAIESVASWSNITWSICHFGIAKSIFRISNNATRCPKDASMWPRAPKFNACPWWHVPPCVIRDFFPKENPYAGADLFAVVRNPYDRVISEFYYRWQDVRNEDQATIAAKGAKQLNEEIQKELEKINISRRGDGSKGIPPNAKYFGGSGHRIPQYDYVFDEHHRRVIHHVLRFENLHEDFSNLMEEYGLNLTLPEKPIRHTASKSLTRHNLTQKTLQLIEKVYWEDFRAFGYETLSAVHENKDYSILNTTAA